MFDKYAKLLEAAIDATQSVTRELDEYLQSAPHLTQIRKVYNFTGRNLTIATRNGARFVVPPVERHQFATVRKNYKTGMFYIQDHFVRPTHGYSRVNMEHVNDAHAHMPETADAVKSHLNEYGTAEFLRANKYTLYEGTLEELEKAGGVIYLKNLDITVGLGDPRPEIFHPICRESEGVERLSDNHRDLKSTGILYKIVDRQSVYGPRYINMHGRVVRIPQEKESELPDGVYITEIGPQGPHTQEPIPLAAADERLPWLHRTEALAKCQVDDHEHQKRVEMIDRQADVHNAKAESDLRRIELEMKAKEQKRQYEEDVFEAERRRRIHQAEEELIAIRRKWQMEEEEHRMKMRREREVQDIKSAGDWLKLVPVGLGAISALLLWHAKMK